MLRQKCKEIRLELKSFAYLFKQEFRSFMSNISTYASGLLPGNRHFFSIIENSESRNLDDFLILEF